MVIATSFYPQYDIRRKNDAVQNDSTKGSLYHLGVASFETLSGGGTK